MGIVAVGKRMIKRHLHGGAINVQRHRSDTDSDHPGPVGVGYAGVMVGVGQDGGGMVVIHVATDPVAHSRGQGISGHGTGGSGRLHFGDAPWRVGLA